MEISRYMNGYLRILGNIAASELLLRNREWDENADYTKLSILEYLLSISKGSRINERSLNSTLKIG